MANQKSMGLWDGTGKGRNRNGFGTILQNSAWMSVYTKPTYTCGYYCACGILKVCVCVCACTCFK